MCWVISSVPAPHSPQVKLRELKLQKGVLATIERIGDEIANNKSLTHLYLSHNFIDQAGTKALARGQLPTPRSK